MTSKEQVNSPRKKLLTPAQVKLCKAIAASDNEFSTRASALLALHDGVTQKETATQTGLSIGQVRYWAARFRQLGMKAFPQTASEVSSQKSTLEKAVVEDTPKKVKKKDRKKTKADKGNKKDKKSKKEKSAKKDKKKAKNKKKTKK
ncbi:MULTISPECIES: helix-turn-helix domain-containing protein [unclassified Methylophaga]|uniref:helix-turn-helix domain-containing protein n=2 Tax=Methylophaga TaxID=40222 RepID=UPI00259D21A4|nr:MULTISPECIES: helix-turn-helix domain-containing protein [unclassified Methylophaga]